MEALTQLAVYAQETGNVLTKTEVEESFRDIPPVCAICGFPVISAGLSDFTMSGFPAICLSCPLRHLPFQVPVPVLSLSFRLLGVRFKPEMC